MGIVDLLLRSGLAVAFLLIAGVVFKAEYPDERTIADGGKSHLFLGRYSTDAIRRELVDALQANSPTDSIEIAKKLATLSPVDELPYEAALAVAFAEGDDDAVELFSEHALLRQPRSLAARLHRLRAAAERSAYNTLLDEYERLIDLRSIDEGKLSAAVIGVFRESNNWKPLIGYLESRPAMGQVLMSQLLDEEIPLSQLKEVITKYPSLQYGYLQRVILDDGAFAAYQTWRLVVGLSDEEVASIPFNRTFEERAEPAPFNWLIQSDRAELLSNGGLYISYTGSGYPAFAKQIISAPPGNYLLRSEAIGRMPEDGGGLEWRIFCVESGQQLVNSVISLQLVNEIETFDSQLNIPHQDCAFQTIEIRGRAGRYPDVSRTKVLSVALIEANN